MRPLHAAGLYGVRGSGPSRFRALEALRTQLVFLTPSHRLLRHIPLLTFLRLRQPQASTGLTPPQPELGRFLRAPSAPRRSAPSCWPARPPPACAASSGISPLKRS